MDFRHLPKSNLRALIPTDLFLALHLAVAERKPKSSVSSVVTQAVCQELGIDPAQYGLTSGPKAKRKKSPSRGIDSRS